MAAMSVAWRPIDVPESGMAYVPQGREIFPNLSVTDNLRMGWVKRGRVTPDDFGCVALQLSSLKAFAGPHGRVIVWR
jgi:ABC-type branched-subunit amino acid transport system ATPase component